LDIIVVQIQSDLKIHTYRLGQFIGLKIF